MLHMYSDPSCPADAFGPVLFCAGADGRHDSCCLSNGVDQTRAGDKCMELCDLRPG